LLIDNTIGQNIFNLTRKKTNVIKPFFI
jgi:hypothetical protein